MRLWDGSIGKYGRSREEEKDCKKCSEYMYLVIKVEEILRYKYEDSFRVKLEQILGLLEIYRNFHNIEQYYKENKRLFEDITIWLICNKKLIVDGFKIPERSKIINNDLETIICQLCKTIQ